TKGQESNLLIRGNTRTKTSYIEGLYSSCKEMEQDDDLELMEKCLLNSRLFSKVELNRNRDITIVEVEERWTLIPIPYARSDRGENKVGLFLLERNLFGRGKMMVFGGAIGERSQSLFLMYRDPEILQSRYFGVFALNIGEEE